MGNLLKKILVQHGKYILLLIIIYHQTQCDDTKIIVDTLSKKDIPNAVAINGKIVDGIKWKDKIGVHCIAISEVTQKEICEPGFKSQLFALQYSFKDTTITIDWKIQDFGSNECEHVYYLKQSLRIVDIENNGIGEPRFFYEFGHDCCDPLIVKYILHVKDNKLAIRGKIPMHEDDNKLYEKNIDKAFQNYSKIYSDFASKDWDDFVKNHYDILRKK